MTPTEAANKLRPNFSLEHMPPEDRHHVLFVEAVAAELGVEPTPFNLQQVAAALDDADIRGDDLHFPLMLYSRQHHAVEGVPASTYYPRHDMVFVTVENEEQMQLLGKNWVENPADLPARGEIPIDAAPAKSSDDGYIAADGSNAHWDHEDGDRPVKDFPAHSVFGADKAYVDGVKEVHSDDTESVARSDENERMARESAAASERARVDRMTTAGLPTEADRVAEREKLGAAQESFGYSTQEGQTATTVHNMGRGSIGDGTSTRPDPDALPADNAGAPTNMKPVKNEIN